MVTRNNRLFGGLMATTNTGRLKSKCGTGDIVLAQKCYGEYVRSLKNCGSCVDSKVIAQLNAPIIVLLGIWRKRKVVFIC